ncbi:hypothetical protein LOTGIDRAFT_173287 [Lottia gigantea]|uniref:Tyrosine specific protein phosphatases domain-containing protein n=1 Tax=Lottia gigantea TaxID=225164 RepID=V4AYR1_LOTGI|nr:hypothetical protein LOTGIDRAFT_173287 [Lottia gigantea]ESP00321.1 hypothetical protein LOTGIDRAFT_173287 [Lottia gigantea]
MNESSDGAVSKEDIHCLLEHFSKSTHKVRSGDMKGDTVMETCLHLIGKDYKYSIVHNFNGELCSQYPNKLVVLEYELTEGDKSNTRDDLQSIYDMNKLRESIRQARFARCRSRFVVPVMLFEGKQICRSATLSSGAEMYGRSGIDFLFSSNEAIPNGTNGEQSEMQLFDRYRGQDIGLLKELKVGYICDLMVEKKKVKFGMNITSSEKVDKENRYSDFTILAVPYPGCEFFKEWKEKCFTGQVIQYDWNQGFNDALLDIPDTPLLSQLPIDWLKYRDWDLIQLTQNYLKLLLHLVTQGDSGLLVHCISGWDRTPLFISLLRLTLWADGVIHRTLTPAEILYLTLGYDWYLFGHNLSDRLNKGEEILSFCFTFLRYIGTEEFSVIKRKRRTSTKLLQPDLQVIEERRVMRANSESNIPLDSVLLDGEFGRGSLRGSNTSISSFSSTETGPITFTVGQDEENAIVFSEDPSKPPSISRCRNSPLASTASAGSTESSLPYTGNHFNSASSSSPVAVPNLHRQSEASRACSPGYGSWQIISSCGSLRTLGSTDSPHNISSEKSSSSGHSHVSFSSCQEASEINNTSVRWQKLDSVRRIFQNAYSNTITTRVNGESSSSSLTSLVNHFAEKVGIKSGKNTVI